MNSLLLSLLITTASSTDCTYLKAKAYELQLDRQHGIMTEWKANTWIEQDMKNAVWQQPQFRDDKLKTKRAVMFANEWFQVCKSGIYK